MKIIIIATKQVIIPSCLVTFIIVGVEVIVRVGVASVIGWWFAAIGVFIVAGSVEE